MKTKLLLTALTCLASTSLFAADSPAVGAAAPDFSVTDSKGKTQSVSQYKGKTVVLEWFNPGCPFVVKHYGSGNMQKLQEEFTGKGVVWLTIDSSAPGKEGHLTAEQAREADHRMENEVERPPPRSRWKSRPNLWREEHAPHVYHQP